MFEQVLSRHGTPLAFHPGSVISAVAVPVRRPSRVEPPDRSRAFGPLFQQVLSRRGRIRECHYGSGSVLTALLYAGVVAFGAWAQAQPRVVDRQDVLVKFVAPPRLAAPAPPRPPSPPVAPRPAPGPRLRAVPDRPHVVLAQVIVAPTAIPQARPPEAEPPAHPGVEDAEADGGDAEVAAVPGGITAPVVDAADVAAGAAGAGTEARPPAFEEARMTHPRFVSGPSPQYTQKALEHEVEGTIEVRCIVTAGGRVKDCRVVKSLPFMDRAVIEALEQRRYEPATLAGRAIDVSYRFRIPLKLSD